MCGVPWISLFRVEELYQPYSIMSGVPWISLFLVEELYQPYYEWRTLDLSVSR